MNLDVGIQRGLPQEQADQTTHPLADNQFLHRSSEVALEMILAIGWMETRDKLLYDPRSPWCNPALLRGVVYIRPSDGSEAV